MHCKDTFPGGLVAIGYRPPALNSSIVKEDINLPKVIERSFDHRCGAFARRDVGLDPQSLSSFSLNGFGNRASRSAIEIGEHYRRTFTCKETPGYFTKTRTPACDDCHLVFQSHTIS